MKSLKHVFPNITDLSVEILPGGITALYCSTKELEEKIQLGLVSTGINKLMLLLLYIASSPNGVVVVDEIENGFYYKALPKVWDAVCFFCKKYDVQLFASTHSRECLDALKPFMKESEADFRLLRAEVSKENVHAIRVFNGGDFEAALETGTELR